MDIILGDVAPPLCDGGVVMVLLDVDGMSIAALLLLLLLLVLLLLLLSLVVDLLLLRDFDCDGFSPPSIDCYTARVVVCNVFNYPLQ